MIAKPPATVFRVTRDKYAGTTADALSGNGGLFDNGRWHSQGRRIIYTSESTTLCLMERLVHADEWIAERHPDRLMLKIGLPDSISFIRYQASDLATQDPFWRQEGSRLCRALGDLWLQKCVSCALVVPSAVNPSDSNILLNPLHDDFAAVLKLNEPLQSELVDPDERVVLLAKARRFTT